MNRQRLVKIIITVLGFLGLVAVAAIVWIIVSFNSALDSVTDIARYHEVRHQFDSSSVIKHFPDDIPIDATDVHLYYSPGFLQGGTIFQLKMKLPPEKIKSFSSQYRPLAKRRYKQGNKNNSPTEYKCSDNMVITYNYPCHTCGKKIAFFPPTYEILVLGDTRGGPECRWNHAEHYGVAIDSSASEIVYWFEEW